MHINQHKMLDEELLHAKSRVREMQESAQEGLRPLHSDKSRISRVLGWLQFDGGKDGPKDEDGVADADPESNHAGKS